MARERFLKDGPFAGLREHHYRVIVADPPWHFDVFDKNNHSDRAPQGHYATMTEDEICDLPVSDLAADGCWLFMWATWPHLPVALRVMKRWGFVYSGSAFVWIKMNRKTPSLFTGLGYTTRKNSEPCLLGRLGKPKINAHDIHECIFDDETAYPETIIESVREHSRKPAAFYNRVYRLTDGPRIELFSRERNPAFDTWGNEVGKFEPTPRPESGP